MLPRDVALYIAQNVRSNARALEGALIRLTAYSSMTGREITLAYTQKVLKNFIAAQAGKVIVDSLQKCPLNNQARKKPKSDARIQLRRIAISFSVCSKHGMGEKSAELDMNWK
jgi:hypothetical protein